MMLRALSISLWGCAIIAMHSFCVHASGDNYWQPFLASDDGVLDEYNPWAHFLSHSNEPLSPLGHATLVSTMPDMLVPILDPPLQPCRDDLLDDTSTPHTEAELRRIYDSIFARSFSSLHTPITILEELARQAPEASPLLGEIEHTRLTLMAHLDATPGEEASSPARAVSKESAPCQQDKPSLLIYSRYDRIRDSALKALLDKAESHLIRGTPQDLLEAQASFQECYRSPSSTRWHGCFGLARVCVAQNDLQNAHLYLDRILKGAFASKAIQQEARALLETLIVEIIS